MVCDNNSAACLQTYEDLLAEISVICNKCNAEYVCIAGGLNTEISWTNSKHTSALNRLNRFVDVENLRYALLHECALIDYTFASMSTDSFTTLDHFILSPILYDSMLSYRSLWEEV